MPETVPADDAEGDFELFAVYTGEQARRVLGVVSVRSVSQRADTTWARQGRVVCWRKEDPGNTTQVNLFLAGWVDDLAARDGGPRCKLRANLMVLPRLAGMSDPGASPPPPLVPVGEALLRSHEEGFLVDGYRREATVEKEARLESERDRFRDRCEMLQAQLEEAVTARRALAKALSSFSADLATG